jgi:Ca2+/Na+ antiporter
MESFSIWHWLVVLLILAPIIFYILSFRKTAAIVNAAGGSAPVNSAWLLLVPLFGMIWFFVLLIKLRNAMRNTVAGEPNNQWWIFGMLAAILSVTGMTLSSFFPDLISVFLLLTQIILAVLHWIKLVQVRQHFQARP